MKIDDKYKWLARDESGYLCSHVKKPEKHKFDWHSGSQYELFEETDNTYSFISWIDDEPYEIPENTQKNPTVKEYIDSKIKHNPINKPSHYIGINGLEVEEVTQNFLPRYKDGYVAHRLGSAVEYLLRSSTKNGLEDIKKAKRNLEQVIEYEEARL